MRDIPNFPNSIAPDASYPSGSVKDRPNGTPVNFLTMSDIWQFFSKMRRVANITANGLPDNETNGYQMYESLLRAARPYKVITGTLTQAGTADPTVTIAENSLSALPTFTRSIAGLYIVTLAGEFTPATKVISFISSRTANRTSRIGRNDNDTVLISSVDSTSGALADVVVCDFEIRVYR